jgi:glutathione peroxidase
VHCALLQSAVAGCNAQKVAPAPAAPAPEAPPGGAAAAADAPAAAAAAPAAVPASSRPSIHTFTMTKLDGTPTSLGAWAGKVLLVVNTASKCGYTPQYEGLQQLHAKYSSRGFAVLGFPSNDFGGQEPGTSQEISSFCTSIYAVNFPMFEKIKVVGQERAPLYALLSDADGPPKWNFHKYLVDKHGRPVQAWPSAVTPGSPEIASAIEAQLAAQ